MSMDEQPTMDDIWVNRLAQKMGILTAQNERLLLEIEMLQAKIKELEEQTNTSELNGEVMV